MIEFLIGFPFALAGLWLTYAGVQEYRSQRRVLAGTVAVDARVVETGIEERQRSPADDGAYFVPHVRYQYEFEGETYESEQVYPTRTRVGYPYRDPVREIVTRYEGRASVTAHVDPAQPDVAFLEVEGMNNPLLFATFGASLTLLTGVYALVLSFA
ncbi:DUF3592 domain-containing protein [Haloarchaeobius amylolyticus]|uniref:DUF3592 domain-containing protein n=1 Tax=Haloarchaeobius amylolyticus TaxID=1198296 RepID=UPI00227024B1|nr:DUF3592 domain-containing protein [Haloarchaeobius amylolyticus]